MTKRLSATRTGELRLYQRVGGPFAPRFAPPIAPTAAPGRRVNERPETTRDAGRVASGLFFGSLKSARNPARDIRNVAFHTGAARCQLRGSFFRCVQVRPGCLPLGQSPLALALPSRSDALRSHSELRCLAHNGRKPSLSHLATSNSYRQYPVSSVLFARTAELVFSRRACVTPESDIATRLTRS
jgi:hypothetical protein